MLKICLRCLLYRQDPRFSIIQQINYKWAFVTEVQGSITLYKIMSWKILCYHYLDMLTNHLSNFETNPSCSKSKLNTQVLPMDGPVCLPLVQGHKKGLSDTRTMLIPKTTRTCKSRCLNYLSIHVTCSLLHFQNSLQIFSA